MRKYNVLILTLLMLFSVGCTNYLMVKPASPEVQPPSSEKATIVFMRYSMIAAAIGAEVFEVNDGELTFVGQLGNGKKVAYQTDPGEKVFMIYGTAADFMIAKVAAGKTYYVIARPNWGTGGFAPTPIRNDAESKYNVQSEEFHTWYNETNLLTAGPEAPAWFSENKSRYQGIYKKYWERFQTKNADQVAQRTLNPEDGT